MTTNHHYHQKKISLISIEGITLIEILLVLVIASVLFFVSAKQYQSYRRDVDAERLKATISTLFNAMANFYSANCQADYKTDADTNVKTLVKAGLLDPKFYTTTPMPGRQLNNPFPINIQNDLVQPGYLKANALAANPFVDLTDLDSNSPYVLQFNLKNPLPDRNVIIENDASTQSVGKIYIWTAQVAVKIIDAQHAKSYQGILGADCISDIGRNAVGGKTVISCDDPKKPPEGSYLVWERLPSFASQGASDLWPTMPTLLEFTQMYTTYPIQSLLGAKNESDPEKIQNYLCGD